MNLTLPLADLASTTQLPMTSLRKPLHLGIPALEIPGRKTLKGTIRDAYRFGFHNAGLSGFMLASNLPRFAGRKGKSLVSLNLNALKADFVQTFGADPKLFRAPGRVNLIGEHTDYNDGLVFPLAINRETVVAVSPRKDSQVRVVSRNLGAGEVLSFDLNGLRTAGNGRMLNVTYATATGKKTLQFDPDNLARESDEAGWFKYVIGAIKALDEFNKPARGVNLMIESNVPISAGLSSSASLLTAVSLALLKTSGAERVNRNTLARIAQRAEHIAGTRCGLMDQLASACGRKGHALLIDCGSLEKAQVPLPQGASVVVFNTGVKHKLASSESGESEYNIRRRQCEEGLQLLQTVMPGIRSLSNLSVEDFNRHQQLLENHSPVVARRVRHVVTENDRVRRAEEALRKGDLQQLGKVMVQSHQSLRDDYEVSCPELNALVEGAIKAPGVIGARMTGGGFGGCVVSLIRNEDVPQAVEAVSAHYESVMGKPPAGVYVFKAGPGASEIKTTVR